MSDHFYMVVEFIDENEQIATISSTWIIEGDDGSEYCYWPKCDKLGKPITDNLLNKLVEQHADIDIERSEKCAIRIKYKSRIYIHAVDKMKLLRNQSSVSQSEDEDPLGVLKRKRSVKKSWKIVHESSSDEENLPRIKLPGLKKTTNHLINANSEVNIDSSNISVISTNSESLIISDEFDKTNHCDKESAKESADVTLVSNANSENENKTYLCNGCRKSEELLPTLVAKIEAIADDIKYLLLCQQNANGSDVTFEEFMTCQTLDDLFSFEEKLKEQDYFMKVVRVFQVVGGKDSIDTTRRIICKLLSTQVQKELNWTGRNNKTSFSKFVEIRKLILVAVRKNCLSRNATDKDVEGIIKLYLRNSMDREGGRGKRSE